MKLFRFLLIAHVLSTEAFARAGGGGSGSGGVGTRGNFRYKIFLYLLILALHGLLTIALVLKKIRARAQVRQAALGDRIWSSDKLLVVLRGRFVEIQQAWSDMNIIVLRKCLTAPLYRDWETQLRELHGRRERNDLSHIEILSAELVQVRDCRDDSQDEVTIEFRASMLDRVLDVDDNVCKSSAEAFSEYWTFRRVNDEWLLDSVYEKRKLLDKFAVLFKMGGVQQAI